MWALRAWSMMSTGTSSLCARFHSKLRTLWAITPSLSSSAKRRISSNSFSRCFLLALVQLAYRSWGGGGCYSSISGTITLQHDSAESKWKIYIVDKNPLSPVTTEDKSHLETVKKVIQLLRREVPRQLSQQVVDIFNDGLMFTSLQTYTEQFSCQGHNIYILPETLW